jgi:hypothetical protein
MALKITREIPLGSGNRGFRFENHDDRARDKRQYQEGLSLEKARFRRGSLAQRLFDRLSYEKKAA